MGLTVHAGGEFEAGNKYYDPYQFTSLVVAMAAKVRVDVGVTVGREKDGHASPFRLCVWRRRACTPLLSSLCLSFPHTKPTAPYYTHTSTPSSALRPRQHPRPVRGARAAGAVPGPYAPIDPAGGAEGAGGASHGRAGMCMYMSKGMCRCESLARGDGCDQTEATNGSTGDIV